jgi:hypothetical protein
MRDAVQIETQGAVVRTARQLSQLLQRTAIACTARMNNAIAGYVTSVALSADEILGRPIAGICYEITGENKGISRWQLRRARGLTPFTGRQAELRCLTQAWQRACVGAGQCIGVVGDAGIGKSRITYEFLTSEDVAGGNIVEAGALEFDAVASFHVVKKVFCERSLPSMREVQSRMRPRR